MTEQHDAARLQAKIKEQKTEIKSQNKAKKEEDNKAKAKMQQEERAKKEAQRNITVGGRRPMIRSEKPAVKRVSENKTELTEEQQDHLKYLGDFAMPG